MSGAVKDTRRIFLLAILACVFTVVQHYPSMFLSTHLLDEWERNSMTGAEAATTTTTTTLSASPSADDAIDICFVSSIFGESEEDIDRPGDFSDFTLDPSFSLFRRRRTTFKFFLFTNLDKMSTPGWTTILKDDLPYRRYITRSRWGKFMGWKEPELRPCRIIFYFDGHFEPDQTQRKRFAEMAARIRQSPQGLAQVPHPKESKTALQEFDSILSSKKDIPRNVEASIEWFQAQPDFKNNCTLYANFYFGYDPNNRRFQEASEFFWERYSRELDSWRDQPLWCYTLEHFNIRPIPHAPIFKKNIERTGHNNHQYDESSDSDALRTAISGKHSVI